MDNPIQQDVSYLALTAFKEIGSLQTPNSPEVPWILPHHSCRLAPVEDGALEDSSHAVDGALGMEPDEDVEPDEVEWWRSLYAQLPAICFTLDGAGVIQVVSRFGAERLYYDPAELVGQGFWELLPEANPTALDQQLAVWVRSPHLSHTWVGQLRRGDGVWLAVRGTIQVLHQQHQTGIILVFEPLGKSLPPIPEARLALNASEPPSFWQALDTLPICAAYFDREQHYRYVNAPWERGMGCAATALLHQPLQATLSPELYQQLLPALLQGLAGQMAVVSLPLPSGAAAIAPVMLILIPDYGPGSASGSASGSAAGSGHRRPQGCFCFGVDGGDRLSPDASYPETELQLNHIFQHSPAAISCFRLYANRHWNYVYRSTGSEDLFGYSAAELMRDPDLWLSRVPLEDREIVTGDRLTRLSQGKRTYIEHRFLHRDGSTRWIASHATALWDEQQQCHLVTVASSDITDRQAIGHALAESQQMLSDLLNRAVVAICGFRVYKGQPIYFDFFSKGSQTIFGYSPDEQKANPDLWLSCVHPEDRATVHRQIYEAVVAEQPCTLDYRFRRKDGALRWISSAVSSVWDDSAQCWRGTVIDADVTERKHLELEFQKTQAELAYVLDSAAAAIFKLRVFPDGHWQYDYISAGCERLYGYEPSAYWANRLLWHEHLHPDDRDRVVAQIYATVAQQQRFSHEYRYYHKDGSLRWIASTYASEWDEDEQCWRVVAVDLDVTRQHHIEDALRYGEARLAAAQSLAQVGYWEYDLLSQQVQFSEEFHYWGLGKWQQPPTAATVLKSLYSAERERLQTAIERAIAQLEPLDLDLCLLDAQGNPLYLEIRGQVIYDDGGNAQRIFGTLQNISERKRLENQVQQQFQREQLLNQVIKALRNSLDLTTVFETAATQTGRLLELDRVHIAEYGAAQNTWHIRCEYSIDPTLPSMQGQRIAGADNPFSDRLKRGELVVLNHTNQISDTINQEIAQALPGSWLLVPLTIDGTCWGSLSLIKTIPEKLWQPWEIELAQAIADQLAIAIQQSQLFRQVNQLNTQLESTVAQRTQQLSRSLQYEHLLRRITDKVRDSLDEAQILQTAVQELLTGLGLDCCDAGIYDLEHRTSKISYEATRLLPAAKGAVIEMATYPDIYRQLLEGSSFQLCAICPTTHRPKQRTVSMLICPIYDDQGMLGDLWLFRAATLEFDAQEVRLVEQVANHCAIALRQSRLYETAQQQVQELAKLNHLKDDFLSTVSHELRSPMANIKMATEMLETQLQSNGSLQQDDLRTLQYFRILHDECARESSLINDLLDLSRLDAESEPLLFHTLNLRDWVLHLAEAFVQRTEAHHQTLIFDLPADLPPITTDLTFLERILIELLHNACKYTPEGGKITVSAYYQELSEALPRSTARAMISPVDRPRLRSQSGWHITVCNTGVEIPPDEQDKIFDKFYRVPNNDPWRTGGTGLGLALVKKRVERLGGAIAVISQNHQTQFVISLPSSPPCPL